MIRGSDRGRVISTFASPEDLCEQEYRSPGGAQLGGLEAFGDGQDRGAASGPDLGFSGIAAEK